MYTIILLSLLTHTELTGTVSRVVDGDTLVAKVHGELVTVRLAGIDAPELRQPFGNASRDRLRELTQDRQIRIVTHGRDKYGRTLGEVFVDGKSVNLTMLRDGMAWHYKRFNQDPEFAAAEIDAHESHRGLWRDTDAVPPWEWRSGKR